MLPLYSTRLGLGMLCLFALLTAQISPALSSTRMSNAESTWSNLRSDSENPYGPTRPTKPRRKPGRKARPITVLSLKPLPLQLSPQRLGGVAYADPVRFILTANKDSIAPGQEIELTIRAQLLSIPPSVLFFFEEQKSFSIKLLTPDGFVQTGGDYYDYIGNQLSTGGQQEVVYSLKGKLTKAADSFSFTLLRGPKDANTQSLFEQKQTLTLPARSPAAKTDKARLAVCDVAKTFQHLAYSQNGPTKMIQVVLKPTVAASVEYSLNQLSYQASPPISRHGYDRFCISALHGHTYLCRFVSIRFFTLSDESKQSCTQPE